MSLESEPKIRTQNPNLEEMLSDEGPEASKHYESYNVL